MLAILGLITAVLIIAGFVGAMFFLMEFIEQHTLKGMGLIEYTGKTLNPKNLARIFKDIMYGKDKSSPKGKGMME